MTKRWELVLGGAVGALGVLLLLIIIPREVKVVASEAGEISPAFFPRIVGWAFILLGVAHVVSVLAEARENAVVSADAPRLGPSYSGAWRALGAFAIGVGYLVLLPGVGFLPATAIAMIGLIKFLGDGPLWRAVIVALPFAWGVELVFSELLKVPLPRAGWLE